MRSLPPFPSRTMSWCWSKSTSLTRSRVHSMSRNPEPYKRLAITHRIPSKRARTARASSRVNTTGSLAGFLARSTPSSQPSSFFNTCRYRNTMAFSAWF